MIAEIFYFACCTGFVLLLAVVRSCTKPKNYPPGPKWWPFVGNTYELKKLTSAKNGQYLALEELRKKYDSDVIGLKLGREYVVAVFGNDLLNETFYRDEFQGRPNNFFMRLRTMGKRIGITMTDGDSWKVHRTFAVRHLKLLGLGQRRMDELICNEYGRMVEKLVGGCVTPTPYLQSAVMNVLWELTAGERFEDPDLLLLMSKRGAAFDMAGGLLNQIPWARYVAPVATGYSLVTEINRQLYAMISNNISEHKKTLTDTPRDFMDAYLHRMNQEVNNNKSDTMFTEEQLIAVCLDLFIAGSTTTSSTLDFAILAMARWPDVQAKVRLTLDEIQPPGTYITAEQILKNRYVEAVLLETKRLNHVTPVIGPRRVLKNTNLKGFSIPKNTTILMSLYSVHLDQSTWGDPEVFRPERFIDKDGKLISAENMHFFGGGKRRCPGETLAQRFVTLMFANLLHDFVIEIDQFPDGLNSGILLSTKPYKIKMTKRKRI
ncbi:Cytochrome P450, E-class, group I,Cytochrome P450,Cytochrome P450, conserved site [Cinara cedri]|uniref:Cytochrome P450, E-class, group I,Cytochrome P450,Cytochrome P450, conserved site n=1 Tax=Cinara cedri TaxID=506608 RepID=A0A5E4N705_9HEMI|nr:Cytochrome P450, E-class, group I,Cytochrome P450,Cytochrome P450, conserved site [Cinara cedri]